MLLIRRFTAMIWIFMILNGLLKCYGCNIDTRAPHATYTINDPGSYFGYTVLQHFNNGGSWILVGAPNGQSVNKQSARNPGALYRCWAAEPFTCDEVTLNNPPGTTAQTLTGDGIIDYPDNGWMGVTLTRQTNKNLGDVTVCGHRFANDIDIENGVNLTANERIDRYPQGICYTLDPDLTETLTRFSPCAGEDVWNDNAVTNNTVRWQGWCQFGMSAKYSVEKEQDVSQTLVFGAAGSYNWTGTTFTQNEDRSSNVAIGNLSAWNPEHDDFYQYAGYSVSVGHFMSSTSQEGVTGAPRANQLVGKVYIYDLKNFTVYQELYGEMMNTYFGGTIEALDINNDGLTDVLVGAPLYSTNQDEGRVYVYINRGGSAPLQLQQTIYGTNTIGARFGLAITNIGDLNLDDFSDVAIGAPYEGGGVVYIYQGDADGLDPAYTQRIVGGDTLPTVQAFGSSIAGGMDFDANLYPDIVIGAYANDTVYLYRTRPLLKLQTRMTVTPDPMDPDMTNCVNEEGQNTSCLNITVCFTYEGLSLSNSIEVIYDLEVDEVKTATGLKSRFLLVKGASLVTKINTTETVYINRDTCFEYKAILQSTASDFLSSLPVKLTYILMDYPVEPPARGDEPTRFQSGLAPVMDSYQCAAETLLEEVNFVRDCGVDAVCETDIRLTGDVEIEGNRSVLVVGGPSRMYVNARVDNIGEEAHQAFLTITHPLDMRYEGLEINQISCISPDGSANTNCETEQVVVTCDPMQVSTNTSRVSCSLGNPMQEYTSRTLRLRFDITDLAWASNRYIPISMVASTSSLQQNQTLADNSFTVQYKLAIEADLGISKSVVPESVFYSSNSTRYINDVSSKQALDEAVNMALTEPDSSSFNSTYIGAPFTLIYRLTNYGSGRMPLPSVLTINIPWRLVDRAWLIFIKNIQVSDTTGTGTCNTADLLALQNKRLLEIYVQDGTLSTSTAEDITPIFTTPEGVNQMGCTKAKCVALTCYINPLQNGYSLEVQIEALQWEHTLITRKLGYVEILTEASVNAQDPNNEHLQGDNENPDDVQLTIGLFPDVAAVGSVPVWIIIVSALGGLLILLLLILVMWKCGFFKRKTREDWEIEADGAAPAPAPAPVKDTPAPNGEPDGSDDPLMKHKE